MGRTFLLLFSSRMYQTSHVCLGLEWEGLQSEDSFRVVGETGVRFGLLVVGMGLWSG